MSYIPEELQRLFTRTWTDSSISKQDCSPCSLAHSVCPPRAEGLTLATAEPSYRFISEIPHEHDLVQAPGSSSPTHTSELKSSNKAVNSISPHELCRKGAVCVGNPTDDSVPV